MQYESEFPENGSIMLARRRGEAVGHRPPGIHRVRYGAGSRVAISELRSKSATLKVYRICRI
jgi:hypothetical protein